MEKKLRTVALAMAVLLLVVEMAAAGGQGPCKMSQEGLNACKPCIRSVKPEENPTDTCCAALKQADLSCLCGYKNSSLLPYLGIEPNRAMELPAKCNITLPEQC
ncbi:hypothetical protein Cni_G20273 [Canna indica]|uniref:Bifunctional inhibitor/plant lipid transfer protein/seed storage helical domain-containing protein n=1 Tax=Canna indica TaxID=4628 RepID=A0AAQ3KNS1_9LILI|nr:hypothetical protein Cni_G20273 [Canna indica]